MLYSSRDLFRYVIQGVLEYLNTANAVEMKISHCSLNHSKLSPKY